MRRKRLRRCKSEHPSAVAVADGTGRAYIATMAPTAVAAAAAATHFARRRGVERGIVKDERKPVLPCILVHNLVLIGAIHEAGISFVVTHFFIGERRLHRRTHRCRRQRFTVAAAAAAAAGIAPAAQ